MKLRLPFLNKDPVVAVVRMQGVIATGTRGQLNDLALAPSIERAFAKGKPAAVALVINSPGGSPVQSSLIAARIRRLAKEKETPVFAFVEDVAASGGYWIATAADEIIADPASVVGSIGVISAGFGAQEFIAKHGIERRVYTAGKSKSQLDMFKAENPDDVARLKTLLDDMHRLFIDQVKTSRGDKLSDDDRLFTGEFWLGEAARDLGLIDGIGHLVPTMKERFGDKVRFRKYEIKRSLFRRFGAGIVGDTLAGIEERAQFARFGL